MNTFSDNKNFPVPALSYIPHGFPMALVDEILFCDKQHIVTRTYLDEKHLFARETHVPAWVGIELMAQSIAAWSGFNSQSTASIGYLLGTRNYEVSDQLPSQGFTIGSVFDIHAKCLLQLPEGLGSFDCHIFDKNATLLAQAKLSVFQPTN